MKNIAFNIETIFMVTFLGFIPYFPGVVDVYGMSSLSRELIICLLAIAVAKNIPYENIVSKCVCIGFALTQIIQVVVFCAYYFSYYSIPYYAVILLFLFISGSSLFLARQFFIRQKFTSDTIDDTFVYYLCPNADDFNGLISALVYFPFSGLKVYANGRIYTYKKGVMQEITGRRVEFYKSRCYAFNTNVKYSSDIGLELDSLVGKKWSFRGNCYSTFEPLFGSMSSLLKGK